MLLKSLKEPNLKQKTNNPSAGGAQKPRKAHYMVSGSPDALKRLLAMP